MPKTKKEIANEYKKISAHEHILLRPDSYIGDVTTSEEYMLLPHRDEEQKRTLFKRKKIQYVKGLYKIIDEIIVNCRDQFIRLKENQYQNPKEKIHHVNRISIDIEKETGRITITNTGEGIPVIEHPVEKIMIPDMLFGHLLTSSNYDDDEERYVGGKNGFGAKLTNIYSKEFTLETIDSQRKKFYKRMYFDNMFKSTPEIVKNSNKTPYTTISFIPDYNRFGMDGITDDFILLMEKRAYDLSACTDNSVKVYFNEQPIEIDQFTDYVKLFLPDEDCHSEIAYTKYSPHWEVAVAPAIMEYGFEQVSFVNGISTTKGGKHIDYFLKQVLPEITTRILKKHKKKIKDAYVKENMMVFINCSINQPSFGSQSKEEMTTAINRIHPKVDFLSSKKMIDTIMNSRIIERALIVGEAKDTAALQKTDGQKKSNLNGIPNFIDAKMAGSKHRSGETSLILTEGLSAKALAVSGLQAVEHSEQYYGVFPLRGKMKNVDSVEDEDIINNAEFANLKKIIGLKENEDYVDNSQFRYGRIIIMTDQDFDGSHIKGLIINFCHRYNLTKIPGYICSLLTPIVKATKGKTEHKFYSIVDFEKWRDSHNGAKGYTVKYYKGLGTSTPKEGKEYFKDMKLIEYSWDDDAQESLTLAFSKSKGQSDQRKEWLQNYDRTQVLDIGQSSVKISDFINKELICFSDYSCIRALPNMMDGFKPSKRKALYCAMEVENLHSATKEIRVSQLAASVSKNTDYHHGEVSMEGCIVGMAQNYATCGNNVNLLYPNGQFGTRLQNGKDCAQSRYIHTYVNKITNHIFHPDDRPLLKYLIDDGGHKIEPEYYVPIIPILLVNGTEGIGTGYSSKLPPFNPLDIVRNLKKMLKGEEPTEMAPWFRGFKGSIKKINHRSYLAKGVHFPTGDNRVEITELPIGISFEKYREKLEQILQGQQQNKERKKKSPKVDPSAKKKPKAPPKIVLTKILRDYDAFCDGNNVKIILRLFPEAMDDLYYSPIENGKTLFEEKFGLATNITFGRSMNFYSSDMKLTCYESVLQILKEYFSVRLHFYQKRYDYLLDEYRRQIALINIKVQFIRDYTVGKIYFKQKNKETNKVRNLSKEEVSELLEGLGYPKFISSNELVTLEELAKMKPTEQEDANYDPLLRMQILSLTKEKRQELENERDSLMMKIEDLENKTPADLWDEDLDKFLELYEEFTEEYHEYMQAGSHDYQPKKKKKGKAKPKKTQNNDEDS